VKYKLAVKQPPPQVVEQYLIGIVGPVEFEQLHHHHDHHDHHSDNPPPPSDFGNFGGLFAF
jgi:hypothetical protein